MKLPIIALSALSLLAFACSLQIVAPDDLGEQGITVKKKPSEVDPPPPAPAPGSSASPATTPAPAPSPATCASLAADTTADGSFSFSSGAIDAKDVYAGEHLDTLDQVTTPDGPKRKLYIRRLSIAFTKTLHECRWRASLNAPHDMSEQRIEISVSSNEGPPPEIGVGTWGLGADQRLSHVFENGARCLTKAEMQAQIDAMGGVSFIGTSYAESIVKGTVKITKRTPAGLEGELDMVDGDGKRTVGRFVAPFCAPVSTKQADAEGVCCDRSP